MMKRNLPDRHQSFFDHLDELRGRLLKAGVAVCAAAVLFYTKIDFFLSWITRPVGYVVFTSPGDAFWARMTLTLWGGLFLAFPFVLYQIWQFVAAGLKEQEQQYIKIYAPVSMALFALGGAFGYFMVVPFALEFLMGFASDMMRPMITVQSYIGFISSLVLAFGVVFELPLVLMFLTRIGIATPEFLIQKRRHAYIILLIVSAVITPPDYITQLLMAAPLIGLYELGIVVSKWSYNRKTKEAESRGREVNQPCP
jgi:sec-independent protein translocase protein TatC